MDIRRGLSVGGTAVVAAAVGAACSYAFSGAIALNDSAAVQVSHAAVVVPATADDRTVAVLPVSAEATGPVIVSAPEPRDLVHWSVRHLAPQGQVGSATPPDAAAAVTRGGSTAGTGQNDVTADLIGTGDDLTATPDGAWEVPIGSVQSPAHSNRDAALAAAPGQNDPHRAGRDQADPRSGGNAVPGGTDDSSECDPPDSGGG